MKAVKCLLCTLLCLSPALGFAQVQKTCSPHAATTSWYVSLSSVQSGDLLVLEIGINSAQAPASVTDTLGTPMVAVNPSSSNNASGGIYYEQHANSGSHTFTVTVGTATSFQLCVEEWSGIAASNALDGTMPAPNTGSSASPVSNPVTPTQAGDLAIVWVVANVSGTTFSSWTHGFALGQSTTANFSAAWASQTYASASSLTGGVTIGSPTGWSASIALFKPAVSPSQFFFGN
jgi:hypothetical protein